MATKETSGSSSSTVQAETNGAEDRWSAQGFSSKANPWETEAIRGRRFACSHVDAYQARNQRADAGQS
jgi:hypothetical protein